MRIGKNTKPLVLKDQNGTVSLMPANGIPNEMELFRGAVIGGDNNYNGIILKSEGKEPIEFATENSIIALSSQAGIIFVYEANQSEPWLLRTNGTIINSREETEKEAYAISSNEELRKKSNEDIEIAIESDILKSTINFRGETFPITNGLVVGDKIYGFKVCVNIEGNESTIVYPTHAPIYGIELNGTDIRVFEVDKSIPWTFNQNGFLKIEAEYNKILRSEQEAYCKRHGITMDDLKQEINSELGIDSNQKGKKLS